MLKTDLVLMHAPSVYDFRKKGILFGPVSDVVPSTQIFEMYPIGFMTMLEYLQRHGYSVRIVNAALRMLKSRRFDVEKLIRSLDPVAFGLDLHWMVHAHGSLELARIIKKHHPTTPVIFGGLSSSYFYEELIRYPQVDYIVRGDSAEEPLRQLMDAIVEKRRPENVPNLVWKDGEAVRVNEFSHVPADLGEISFDYRKMMRSSAKHRDLLGHLPFLNWLTYPIVMGLSCRGCVHNCVICGGSAAAYRAICKRRAPALRDPGALARDIGLISHYIKAPAIVLGDLLQGGTEYAQAFLDKLAEEKIENEVALEFFAPPPRALLEQIARAIPRYNIQISPESHDVAVRTAFGRRYDNASLERFLGDAMELGCQRVDVFFMIGLPKQTPDSVRDTIRYCESLLQKFDRVLPFISPLAPFLDPGSKAFEDPEGHGYRLYHRTLEEHRQALQAPSWKYTLNYETIWMSRDELVESTYEAALALNQLKAKYGKLKPRRAAKIERRIAHEAEVSRKIDAALQIEDAEAREERIAQVMKGFGNVGRSTICTKDEMNWRTRFIRFDAIRVVLEALTGSS